MTREIYLKYTLPEEIEGEYDDVCDELAVTDLFDGGEGLEVLPPPTIKTCSCEAYRAIISDKDAEIERLKEIGMHGCDCSQDDACRFARELDEAQSEIERSKERINELEKEIMDFRKYVNQRLPFG